MIFGIQVREIGREVVKHDRAQRNIKRLAFKWQVLDCADLECGPEPAPLGLRTHACNLLASRIDPDHATACAQPLRGDQCKRPRTAADVEDTVARAELGQIGGARP